MASYYYPTTHPAHHLQRSYSHSYYPSQPQVVHPSGYSPHHSSPRHAFYGQPGAYYASPQYAAPAAYHYDTGRQHHQRHGHGRSGSSGTHYTTSANSTPSRHRDTSRHSPRSTHTTTRRSPSAHVHRPSRSQSVPRQTVRIADTSTGHRHRRSESRPRETVTHNALHHRRGSTGSGEPFGERIRRMFGFGGGSSAYRDQRGEYIDTRSGRTVDWRGRPIYRV